MMIKQFLEKHWKKVCIAVLAICIACGIAFWYNSHKDVPMAQINGTSPTEVHQAMSKLDVPVSIKEATQISKQVEKRKESAPDASWKSVTQKESDKSANGIAKSDKADAVLKETKEKEGEITNNYYGIHLEKKNEIGFGATVVDSKAYFTVSYQRNNVEVALHSQDLKTANGFTVQYKRKF